MMADMVIVFWDRDWDWDVEVVWIENTVSEAE